MKKEIKDLIKKIESVNKELNKYQLNVKYKNSELHVRIQSDGELHISSEFGGCFIKSHFIEDLRKFLEKVSDG